jgi:hypothetical protein
MNFTPDLLEQGATDYETIPIIVHNQDLRCRSRNCFHVGNEARVTEP